MSLAREQTPEQLGRVEKLEAALLAHVNAAAEDLQRIECLEEEQRAEIHVILEALKHEGQSHTGTLEQLKGEYWHA